MKEDTVLILERSDLIQESWDKDPALINHRDLIVDQQKKMITHSVVVFIDKNGTSKIIKNRYGDMGEKTEVTWLLAKIDLMKERHLKILEFLNKIRWWQFSKRKRINKFLNKISTEYNFKEDE